MTYHRAAIWIAVIIVLTIIVLYGPTLYKRERSSGYSSKPLPHAMASGSFPLNAPPLPLRRVAAKKHIPGEEVAARTLPEGQGWVCLVSQHPCPEGMRIPFPHPGGAAPASVHREKYGGPGEEVVTTRHRDGFQACCSVNAVPCPAGRSIDCRTGESISDPTPKRESMMAGRREGYGPPPGMARAISHTELPYLYGDRGWADFPRELEANTASSISHFIERSA